MIGIIDPAHVLVLLQAASSLSREYDIPPDPPPQVIELTTAEMDQLTCKGHKPQDTECKGAKGYYQDGDNAIYIDGQWLNSKDAQGSEDSATVHELTHWLQYKHNFGGEWCPRIAAREQEAYRVENLYIKQYEHGRGLPVSMHVCGYKIGE